MGRSCSGLASRTQTLNLWTKSAAPRLVGVLSYVDAAGASWRAVHIACEMTWQTETLFIQIPETTRHTLMQKLHGSDPVKRDQWIGRKARCNKQYTLLWCSARRAHASTRHRRRLLSHQARQIALETWRMPGGDGQLMLPS
jgi:hypothetical protein